MDWPTVDSLGTTDQEAIREEMERLQPLDRMLTLLGLVFNGLQWEVLEDEPTFFGTYEVGRTTAVVRIEADGIPGSPSFRAAVCVLSRQDNPVVYATDDLTAPDGNLIDLSRRVSESLVEDLRDHKDGEVSEVAEFFTRFCEVP